MILAVRGPGGDDQIGTPVSVDIAGGAVQVAVEVDALVLGRVRHDVGNDEIVARAGDSRAEHDLRLSVAIDVAGRDRAEDAVCQGVRPQDRSVRRAQAPQVPRADDDFVHTVSVRIGDAEGMSRVRKPGLGKVAIEDDQVRIGGPVILGENDFRFCIGIDVPDAQPVPEAADIAPLHHFVPTVEDRAEGMVADDDLQPRVAVHISECHRGAAIAGGRPLQGQSAGVVNVRRVFRGHDDLRLCVEIDIAEDDVGRCIAAGERGREPCAAEAARIEDHDLPALHRPGAGRPR